jgi:hypothetical protein
MGEIDDKSNVIYLSNHEGQKMETKPIPVFSQS